MKNEFYYKLLNINNNNKNKNINLLLGEIIKDVVSEVSQDNKNLVGLCRVVATNISCELEKNRIDYRIISLCDYGLYDHEFIIARNMEDNKLSYYLIDPTFIQFKEYYPYKNLDEYDSMLVSNLIKKGYSRIDNKSYNYYFKAFEYQGREIDINDMFLDFKKKRKK